MASHCKHIAEIRDVVASAPGCEECLRTRDTRLHLRVCRSCGHVGCCDQSPNPPDGWGWCYVDEVMFDLSDRPTPQLAGIPRYY
jgi:hypothetical protein